MSSTSVDYPNREAPPPFEENKVAVDEEKHDLGHLGDPERRRSSTVKVAYDHTYRKLKPRHIQLIGIGGTIGTALYVQIGRGLLNGGPGSLFLAFTIW